MFDLNGMLTLMVKNAINAYRANNDAPMAMSNLRNAKREIAKG